MFDSIFNKDIRYAGIEYDDVANGEGLGVVFFTQFCPHHCVGCHNTSTWSKDGGLPFAQDVIDNLLKYYEETPFARRLTISGGEPFANIELSEYISETFKKKYPNKKIWVYTGYSFDEIKSNDRYSYLLSLVDYIVDGKFDIVKRDTTLKFRGSANQNIWRKDNNTWIKEI